MMIRRSAGLRAAPWTALAAALFSAACTGRRAAPPVAAAPPPPPEIVDAKAVHPGLILDLRYATKKNFTHHQIYPIARCALRPSVAQRLAEAAEEIEQQGLRLKVYDCYRPLSVQKEFWKLVPDERYVADPKKGSRHNRGAAVDLTLADRNGKELEMPSAFDDFTEKAHRDYLPDSPLAGTNRERLEALMLRHGFLPLPTEWWHFDAKGWEAYSILDVPLESLDVSSSPAASRPGR